MTRIANFKKRAKKKYGGRPITGPEAKKLFEEYVPGMDQHRLGAVMAESVERFLAGLPEAERKNLETSVIELHSHASKFKRFRIKAMTMTMLAYHNAGIYMGTKPFDAARLVESVSDELDERFKIKEFEKYKITR